MSASTVGVLDSSLGHAVVTDSPRTGDVLVTPDLDAQGRFAISQVPGRPSMSWNSQARAVDAARAYARAHSVDVWLRNATGVERVHAYRGPGARAH